MPRLSSRIVQGFHGLNWHQTINLPVGNSLGISYSYELSFCTSLNSIIHCCPSRARKAISSNIVAAQVLATAKRSPLVKFSCWQSIRQFSSSSYSELGKTVSGNLLRKIVEKPAVAVTSTFSRYRQAIGLQIDAFWKRNYVLLIGAGGVVVCGLLWRVTYGIASTFVGLSEGMHKYGFLAFSAATVAFAGLYIRTRIIINPDRVYRIAMRKLNTSAGILEVMGAPLIGTPLRAYVMSGGGVTLANFKLRLRNKRCFLIFPVQGSERKGLVSVGVKKKKGQYAMKLLAVDVPMASGGDQRLFLVGDEEEYRIGGGLISELRDPVIKAMAAGREFVEPDEVHGQEEEEDEELEEAAGRTKNTPSGN